MSESRSVRPTTASVEDVIHGQDRDGSLSCLDAAIVAAAPHAARQVWQGVFWGGTEQSIVGYGLVEQPRPRGRSVEWFLIGLAQQTRHLSLYVNAVENGAYLAADYGPRLGRTKVGAASIAFRSAHDLDLQVLDEMVRHAFRLALPG